MHFNNIFGLFLLFIQTIESNNIIEKSVEFLPFY